MINIRADHNTAIDVCPRATDRILQAMNALRFFLSFLILASASLAQEQFPLRIGVIFPFSGIEARQGHLGRTGVELALKELDGFYPEMTYEDSQSDAKQAVAAFGKLQTFDKVDVVLTMGSPTAMALLPIANRSKTPLLAMAVVSGFSAPGDFGFRLMGAAPGFGARIRDLLVRELGKKRLALAYVEGDYGTAYARFFEGSPEIRELLMAKESFLPGTSDFRPLLLRLKSSKPDALILAAWAVEAGTLLRQAKEMGLSAGIVACPGACDNPDIAVSGAGGTDPLVIVASDSRTTHAREKVLADHFHEAPTSVVLRFFDAIKLLKEAGGKCAGVGEARRVCLREALAEAENVPGSSYPLSFDENGDIRDLYQLKIVRGAKLIAAKVVGQQVVPE